MTPTSRPSTPDLTISTALCRIGLCGRWCPVSSLWFALSAASTRRLPSSSVCPIGFSTRHGTPALTHRSPCSTCIALGVARTTPSGLSLAKHSPRDWYSGTLNLRATSAAFGPGSMIEARTQLGLATVSSIWRTPIIPAPATAMRTRATDGSLSSGVERDDSATRHVESIAKLRNEATSWHPPGTEGANHFVFAEDRIALRKGNKRPDEVARAHQSPREAHDGITAHRSSRCVARAGRRLRVTGAGAEREGNELQ